MPAAARRIDPVVGALLVCLAIYYAATRGIFQGKASGDGYLGFLYLPGLVFHHSLDLARPAPEWVSILGRERTGRVANPVPIGAVAVWLPPYLVGLGLRQAGGALVAAGLLPGWLQERLRPHVPPARPLSAHGPFDYWMAGLGSLAAGLVGLGLLFRLLVRRLPVAAARLGVLSAALGTPLCFYLVTQPLYQHAVSFFAVTLFIERWDAWRGAMTGRRWAALGALGGFMMLVRLQEGMFLLLPGLDLLGGLVRQLRQRRLGAALQWVGHGALLVGVAALCFAPQAIIWWYMFGELRAPQPPGHMRWGSPALVETLTSMRAGLLPWMPILYLALPGLVLGRRALRGLGGPLLLLLALEWYVNACAWDYHGSWGFGPRRFTDAAATVGAGVGGLWARVRGRGGRAVLGALLVVLLAWNLCLGELLRRRKIKNSAVGAFPLVQWVRWAGGPPWLERWAARWGYPPAWPAAWAYALIYRMPAVHFEGMVGNYLLERDWRVRSYILTPGFAFAEAPAYVISGVAPPPPGGWRAGQGVPAGPEVRLLVPLSAREPVRMILSGDFSGQARQVQVWWNGERLPQLPASTQQKVVVEVPARLTHARARLNEIVLRELPPGTRLQRLDLQSWTAWWKR
ncbi:MAG: hypothetical protein RMK29_08430 [Myxococcales bacterium]|nr:hypothetical protein [Myxococcota bacterium]MDW8281721.1 hypothetical protein [Myxococcales bacterium]